MAVTRGVSTPARGACATVDRPQFPSTQPAGGERLVTRRSQPVGVHVIDRVRYFLGVATVVVVPLGLLYWLVIHQWAWWWRMWGPARTYLVVLPVLTALAVPLYAVHEQLLGADLGTKWSLIGVGLVLSGVSHWLEFQNWRHLSIATLVGIPELSQQSSGRLLRDGIYGMVRHPRYLSAGIGLVASVVVVNHLGLYILIMLRTPAGIFDARARRAGTPQPLRKSL